MHRGYFSSLDVQTNQANPSGEEKENMSAFLGTIWFMLLLSVVSFCAGMVFKAPLLKLINKKINN